MKLFSQYSIEFQMRDKQFHSKYSIYMTIDYCYNGITIYFHKKKINLIILCTQIEWKRAHNLY